MDDLVDAIYKFIGFLVATNIFSILVLYPITLDVLPFIFIILIVIIFIVFDEENRIR